MTAETVRFFDGRGDGDTGSRTESDAYGAGVPAHEEDEIPF
jgi:hypothetical protein